MNFYNTLSEKEKKKINKFEKKHWEKCNSNIIYIIYPGSIGYGISTKCVGCKKEKDVTDYGTW